MEQLRAFAERQAEREGNPTTLRKFLILRGILRMYLFKLQAEEDDLRDELEEIARTEPNSRRMQKYTGDWMRVSGQVKELKEMLHEK